MLNRTLRLNMKQFSGTSRLIQSMVNGNQCHDDRFEVKRLTVHDKHETVELMKQHFVHDYVLQYIPNLGSRDVENYITSSFDMCVKQNYSFAIFEKSSSSMIAAVLNYIRSKNQNARRNENLSPALQQYANFTDQLEKNMFEFLKCEKLFHIGINTTVHAAYRKLGLFSVIEQGCQYMGLQSNCDYMVVRATTEYLVKAADVVQLYKVLNEIQYVDYIDPETHENPFANVQYPHVRARLLYLNLKELRIKPIPLLAKL